MGQCGQQYVCTAHPLCPNALHPCAQALSMLACARLASEAAASSLEAADIDSGSFDPYDARGSGAVRRPPSLAWSSMHRPMRRPAPSRVPLLSRSLPEDRQSVLTSAFAASDHEVTCSS